jgi:hypothetical protein
MTENEYAKDWVYVFICDPGPKETFLGLYNKEKDVNFIPAFRSKEDANDCYLDMPREKGKKYELQAVHVEELFDSASKSGFVVALVDGKGNVLDE